MTTRANNEDSVQAPSHEIFPPGTPVGLIRADRWLGVIAALMLFAMVSLTCVDVVGRYFLNRPLTGAFELTELAMGALVFSSLPLVTLRRQQVTVDLFDWLVPDSWQRFQYALVDLIAAVCTGLVAWRLWIKAAHLQQAGETTAVLQFVVFPLVYYMAVMASLTVAVMLVMAWTDALARRPGAHS